MFLVPDNKIQNYAKLWRRRGGFAIKGNMHALSQRGLGDGVGEVRRSHLTGLKRTTDMEAKGKQGEGQGCFV